MRRIRFLICKIFLLVLSLSALQTTAGQQAEGIHDAAAAGDLEKVRALLEADSSLLELKDNNGCTPLTIACLRNKPVVANYLIDKGADVNNRDKWRQSPLITICSTVFGNDFDLIKRLIDKGADVNAQGNRGESALEGAVARGNIKVAKFLIDNGANINAYDKAFGTILHQAINVNQLEMATLLLGSGAKLNQKDPSDNTELHLAALQGNADIVRLLMRHGIDIHALDRHKHTSLYYAAKHGYQSVADLLIKGGTKDSSTIETNYGKAPQLTRVLKDGEAFIWYLGAFAGDGYIVKTKGHILLFDPPGIEKAPESGLANGHINPSELADQKVTILISKPEWERYELRAFELAKQIDSVDIVISFNPEGKLASQQDSVPSYHLALPNQSISINDLKVHIIPAALGGVGYLVEVDGLKVFYAGYHACNDTSMVEQYRKEINFLKPFGPIDLAILPVGGHLINSYTYNSYIYLVDQLLPKAVYLMHGTYDYNEYFKCAELLGKHNISVQYPEGKMGGDRFHYLQDSIRE